MSGNSHKMDAIGSPNSEPFRMKMQKQGFSVPPADVPRPMTANPVKNVAPGLGAKTLSHPFKAGKSHI
jgi:hypothetical protein